MFERLFAPKLDDNSLLQKAKESQSAFAEVYDRFANLVFRFVRRRVATDQDAEDIVSETFMAVAASLDHYDETKSKKCTTWILSIAHNKLQDYLRKIYNTPDIYDPEEHEIQDTSEDIMQATHDKHIYDEIMTYVQQLPDKQIAIFSLRHVEGLQNKDIADVCGVDEKTISSTLSIISKKIRSHLVGMKYID